MKDNARSATPDGERAETIKRNDSVAVISNPRQFQDADAYVDPSTSSGVSPPAKSSLTSELRALRSEVRELWDVNGGDRTRQNPLPAFLTVKEVAQLLRTSPKAVYIMKERGRLPGAVKMGARLLVRRDALLKSLVEAPVVSSGRNRR